MNLPNKLTLARMILTPIFLVVFLTELIPYHFLIGLIVYIAGCITDFLDGKIARKYNLISTFGKLADPVADKMLTTAALLVLMKFNYLSIFIVFIILTREFAVTSIRLAASAQGVIMPAKIWGKIKTATQMIFTIAIMFGMVLNEFALLPGFINLYLWSTILMSITAVFAIISGIIYIIDGIKLIDFSK